MKNYKLIYMNVKKVFLPFIIFLIIISCGNKSNNKLDIISSRVYPIQVVKKQTAILESVFPIIIRGEEDAEIKPRVSGYIDQVFVDEGEVVTKGQALFSINSPNSDQDLASAIATLESAEANLKTAQLDVERMRPLAQKEIVSSVQIQSYENTLTVAESRRNEARVALNAAQVITSWTTVTSPIDGVLGSIPYRSGNMVTDATTLTTVSKTDKIYAYFSINEKALTELLGTLKGKTQKEKISNIPKVSLILADGSTYYEKGKIVSISGAVNTQTGSVTLRAEFPNKEGLLLSGASGKISIPRELHDVFILPQKATFAQQDKIVLYKVVKDKKNQSDSTVQSIITVLPLPDGKNYAVTSGLEEGERIVFDGVATLGNARKILTEEQKLQCEAKTQNTINLNSSL